LPLWRADQNFIMHFVNYVLKPARNVRRSVKNTLHIMLRVRLALMFAGNARKRVKRARKLLAAVNYVKSLQPTANRLPVIP
jgi:hypothetical protein